jgi:hypothetical protein
MIVTGWNNGSPNNTTGSGYGVRLRQEDRDKHFRPRWSSVSIKLEGGGGVPVNLTPSFWRRCAELRSPAIGKWLLDRDLAPWPKGNPPRLHLTRVGNRRFRLGL